MTKNRTLVILVLLPVFVTAAILLNLNQDNTNIVIAPKDWNDLVSEVIGAHPVYEIAVIKTATKYTKRSSEFEATGELYQAKRAWIIGHLFSWYGNELASSVIPSTSMDYISLKDNSQALLENRQIFVESGRLTLEELKLNYENLNGQLELFGRPICKSLSMLDRQKLE